jgi:hypothetical protein
MERRSGMTAAQSKIPTFTGIKIPVRFVYLI